MTTVSKSKGSLPYGWKVCVSKSYPDRVYYFNEHTGASSWECPELLISSKRKKIIAERTVEGAVKTISKQFIDEDTEDDRQNQPKFKVKSPDSLPSALSVGVKRKILSSENCKNLTKENETFVGDDPFDSFKEGLQEGSEKNKNTLVKTAVVTPVIFNSKLHANSLNETNMSSKNRASNVTQKIKSASSIIKFKIANKSVSKVQTSPITYNPQKNDKKTTSPEISQRLQKSNFVKQSEKRLRVGHSSSLDKSLESANLPSPKKKKKKKNHKRSESRADNVPAEYEERLYRKRLEQKFGKRKKCHKHKMKSHDTNDEKLEPLRQKKRNLSPSMRDSLLYFETAEKCLTSFNENHKLNLSTQREVVTNDLEESSFNNLEENDSSDVEMLDVSNDLSLDVVNDIMQIDSSSVNPESYYIVVDTNVLMSYLKLIDELKDTPLQGCGPPHLVIPWIVIQELDSLKIKGNRSRQSQAGVAVRYLYGMLNSKHPRFHGQTAKMASKCSKDYRGCNDDRILGFCAQLCEIMPKEKVILLTDDRNLCNKALINDIVVHTTDSLFKNLKADLNVKYHLNSSDAQQNNENRSENDLKMEVDYIICATKMLLKNALERVFEKAMQDAFGDVWRNIVSEPQMSLVDLLSYFKRYWPSVFGLLLPQYLYDHFLNLISHFKLTKGFFCKAAEAMDALTSVEIICQSLVELDENIKPLVSQITILTSECKALVAHEENQTVDKIEDPNSVLAVFSHIWDLMNYLCGMIMDFFKIPHNFPYNKPDVIPSAIEFKLLISNLYPNIHQIKKALSCILDSSSNDKEKSIKTLYNFLVQFVPSLQIQAPPPPLENFTVNSLKSFCLDPDSSEMLKNGFVQLLEFHSKLTECIEIVKKKP